MEKKDQQTLIKVGLGVLAFKWLSGEFIFLFSIGILLAIASIGIVIGLAEWFLKYGLIALGIYVIFVLTLRWLHGGKKQRDLSDLPDFEQLTASSRAKAERIEEIDPDEALARFKAEHLAELQQPTPPPRKP
ncbi:hypothetical protein [Myxococcus sp. CA039A]|uniref:hypothetical protein n=1 Tax=Myxococcus sp. CA039A TaxID=2741737 RepID=UPI00157A96A0|nr:hypothetical protein [Myxococcus sp. CA039A]NTX54105.1 hypothetical protein [Myxococcus sp. CA039A]